jgi:polysaccharide pyruvyl transferase WcaK-like protein
MRILVDHDGYDLLNLGGVAMLQGCVARLRQQWPDAEIKVLAHAPARLERYCPGTAPIGRTFADSPYVRVLPRKVRLGSEQIWRIAGPPLCNRVGRDDRRDSSPRTAIEAARWADVVVAAGGGYLTDTWWWHAAGVLSLLDFSQRLGKPTAMFGQGIGPLRGRAVRALASKVLPGLTAIGLREEVTSLGLALSCGARRDVISVTGDEAIEVIPDTTPADAGPGGGAQPSTANALGFNIRAAGYSGIGRQTAVTIGNYVIAAAHEVGAPIVGLPVSRYATSSDRAAIGECLEHGRTSVDVALPDLSSPAELISASASCRAVVTSSYHAAVCALAQGVPAVCLSRSRYYDAKFAGLNALFPEACEVVSLIDDDAARSFRRAILQAWEFPASARSAAREAAARQRTAARRAYEAFRLTVDSRRELSSPVF